jgi:PAS domain-containing protein
LLAQGSVRFGQLELAVPVSQDALQAPWLEVRQLAAAQEQMRQQLLANTSELQQARSRAGTESFRAHRRPATSGGAGGSPAGHHSQPIFYKGADTRFIGCNQAYEQAFGINRSDFIGKRVLDLDYLPPPASTTSRKTKPSLPTAAAFRVKNNCALPMASCITCCIR